MSTDQGAPSSSLDGYVKALTSMTADDDAHAIYEAWAPNYEDDLVRGYGYNAHRTAAKALAQRCDDRAAAVLDLGCGTGLVGVELAAQGFTCIDGFDASENMLGEARAKGVYRQLVAGDLRDPAALTAGAFDAAVAVGVFGGGHVGPEDLHCFLRPVRAGGTVVLYANGIPFVEDDYRTHLTRLEDDGWWRVVRIEQTNYMDRIDRPGYLVVGQRTGAPAR